MTQVQRPAEPQLYVFSNDYDWVIAESKEDAWDVWCKAMGENREDYDPGFDWSKVDDNKKLLISLDDDMSKAVWKTAKQWVHSVGRGFLASTEY